MNLENKYLAELRTFALINAITSVNGDCMQFYIGIRELHEAVVNGENHKKEKKVEQMEERTEEQGLGL